MKKQIFYLFILLLFSCAPERYVKPLAAKQHASGLAVGGPLIKFGETTIPMPFLTANYGYGIDSTLTTFGAVNITSALFGNVQLELGATRQVLRQQAYIPALSISPVFNLIARPKAPFKVYPQLDVNAFWEYGKHKNYFYIGFGNWFEFAAKRTLGEKQTNHWLFFPLAGHCFAGKQWDVLLETKILAPNLSNEKLVVEYRTPLKNNGAFGVYIGCTRKF
ncbi:MAG TPA: hypothetical protein PLU53_07505 [Bacteroidia bacterium]|nr:hypothetical protein [Bacteroidia bacterium]